MLGLAHQQSDTHTARISYDLFVNEDGKHYLYLNWHNAVKMNGLSSRILKHAYDVFKIVGIFYSGGESMTIKFYVKTIYIEDPFMLIEDFFWEYLGVSYTLDTSYMPNCPEWEY